ncbi:MAG TPA: hypothetical protein VK528_14240 [Flavobacterium sp.]|nr:hypothetical protein [Flavobacterium sp.]
MDTSVTIIGVVIMALVGIPLYKVFRSNALNKTKIKEIMSKFPQCNFGLTESQNKKVLALDEQKKSFLLIDFNYNPEQSWFVDLNNVSACRLIPTTQGNSNDIVKIEFEFLYKDSTTKLIPFYSVEHDQVTQVCLYEDHELAKKWQKQIIICLSS